MKKHISILVLTFVLAFGVCTAQAEHQNPVDQLTGKVWMDSSREIKKAVLFGVDCAVTIEHFVDMKAREEYQKTKKGNKRAQPVCTLSPFEKAWSDAFHDMTRDQIVDAVDSWYKQHPDKLDTPVFTVLWNDIIVPKNQTR